MADYDFTTIWLIEAPIEKVWEAIRDYKNLPTWWKAVDRVVKIEPGDENGLGSVWKMTWKTPLTYTLTFTSRIITVESPNLLELTAKGEVEGTGRWELSTSPEGTLVCYYWKVKTTKAWMNFLALFIRLLMEWNHNIIMKQGAEGLAKFLEARLLKS